MTTLAARHSNWITPILAVALLAAMLIALTLGRYDVPLSEVVRIVLTTGFGESRASPDTSWVVVEVVRMPRILLVTLCGINLGLAGAAMQGTFRNPLAGPEVVGVTAGASFGGTLALWAAGSAALVIMSAFAVGLGAMAITLLLSRAAGRSGMLALLLAGIIVGTFFGALTEAVQYLADESQLPSILYWLLGSFSGATYTKVAAVAVVSLVAGSALVLLRWRINLLSLGETDARSLGLNVTRLRWTILVLVSALVAAQVAVSGGIAFVGLIIPHVARRLVGAEHSRLLPVSGLLGGLYLLVMDCIARSATSTELPIGVLTSLVGAPIFGFLFWRLQVRGWNGD
jgi:iron complex transport system permease protein